MDAILDAAKRIVSDHGADALTMEALAAQTGLSRTTLYRRTGGREVLLDALEQTGLSVGDRTEARERILAAARAVFSRNGFAGATADQIAEEANVSLVTIYRQFGDKEGLAFAVLQESAPRRAIRAAKPTGDLHQDLMQLTESILVGLRDEGALVRWMLIETLQESEFLPRVRARSPMRTADAVARLFATHPQLQALDTRQLSKAFIGMVMAFGVFEPLFHKQPVPDPAATARTITDLFLRGALP